MKFIVDAMGGDNCPNAAVKGVVQAIRAKEGFDIILVGDKKIINTILDAEDCHDKRITIIDAPTYVDMADNPVKVLKQKRDASMFKCMDLLKEGQGDLMISAGSTGALLVGSSIILGRIKGINSPSMPASIPNRTGGFTLLLDSGLNPVIKPDNYVQFAKIGSVYYNVLTGAPNPKVGLLNMGTENSKGNQVVKEAFEELMDANVNFAGNIESGDILKGHVQVVVCDGFTGNCVIKAIEGTAKMLTGMLRGIFEKSVKNKAAYVVIKGDMTEMKRTMNTDESAGAPILGVNGLVIKTHGNSKDTTFASVILKKAMLLSDSRIVERLTREFAK